MQAESHDHTQIAIPISKLKVALSFMICVALIVISIWIMTSPVSSASRGAAVLFALSFGYGAIMFAKMILDSRPGLVLDEEGIFDPSGMSIVGKVRWEEIESISALRIKTERMIVVQLNDPAQYISRNKGMTRKRLTFHMAMFGSPIYISSGTLLIEFDELFQLMNEKLKQYTNHQT